MPFAFREAMRSVMWEAAPSRAWRAGSAGTGTPPGGPGAGAGPPPSQARARRPSGTRAAARSDMGSALIVSPLPAGERQDHRAGKQDAQGSRKTDLGGVQ